MSGFIQCPKSLVMGTSVFTVGEPETELAVRQLWAGLVPTPDAKVRSLKQID